jgi:protein-arginine deiminase
LYIFFLCFFISISSFCCRPKKKKKGNGNAALPPATSADLLADASRDGAIRGSLDQNNEDAWSPTSGTVCMCNLDDDDDSGRYDLSDDAINGLQDVADLARFTVRQFAGIAADHYGGITISDALEAARVRIFRYDNASDSWTVYDHNAPDSISAADIAADDITFGLETVDIQETNSNEAGKWNGMVTLTFTIYDAGGAAQSNDSLVMYAAPYLMLGNLHPAAEIYVTEADTGTENNYAFIDLLRVIVEGCGLTLTVLPRNSNPGEQDRWTQDAFEIGYQSLPAFGGGEHVVHVALNTPIDRPGKRYAPEYLWGIDYGFLQISSPGYTSHDAFGNIEVAPPCDGYPLGRVLIGGAGGQGVCAEGKAFLGTLPQSPYLEIDTTWLAVGHVDEVCSFVPAQTGRGWKLCLASPAVARGILQALAGAGKGSLICFEGKSGYQQSISAILGDSSFMSYNETCQGRIDSIRSQLKTALGIDEPDIIDLPVLFQSVAPSYKALAYSPGVVNMLVLDGANVVVPDPFGPVDETDAFKADINAKLNASGLTVHYIDDWNEYHVLMGEVHCGTNARRTPSFGAPWWSIIIK